MNSNFKYRNYPTLKELVEIIRSNNIYEPHYRHQTEIKNSTEENNREINQTRSKKSVKNSKRSSKKEIKR